MLAPGKEQLLNFPSFSEGLSLRGYFAKSNQGWLSEFPFLFGGTFIEGWVRRNGRWSLPYFPSFSEGLSLRGGSGCVCDG